MEDDIQKILTKAATASVYTSASTHRMTPSRAGYPLLQQVLELLVLPKLPQPQANESLESSIARQMSIAMGYVFEQTLPPRLEKDFSPRVLVEQPALQWKDFVGTADFIAVDKEKAVVIDAKCMNVKSLRDAKERKFNGDNWSYPTQLAIYSMAASELYPSHSISAWWYVYSIPMRKVIRLELQQSAIISLANAADKRFQKLQQVEQALRAFDFKAAASLATSDVSELIIPKAYMYGNLCAATPFHYNPYAELFFYEFEDEGDNDGYPLEQSLLTVVVEKLMKDAYSGVATDYQSYIKEVYNELA